MRGKFPVFGGFLRLSFWGERYPKNEGLGFFVFSFGGRGCVVFGCLNGEVDFWGEEREDKILGCFFGLKCEFVWLVSWEFEGPTCPNATFPPSQAQGKQGKPEVELLGARV